VRTLHPTRTLRAALLALASTALLAGTPDDQQATADFETPSDEPPAASLPPNEVAGENFHIQDPVHSDGLMRHYVVESRFGVFAAYGHDQLRLRLHEVAALTTIANTSEQGVVLRSVARGLGEEVKPVWQIARNPVGTVLGIPTGISHLLGGYIAHAEEIGAQTQDVIKSATSSKGGSGVSRTASQAEDAAKKYASDYLGLTAAERRWYAKLAVDPYTRNEVLRHAVERLARIDAGATLGLRVVPGLPLPGEVGRALDAIYQEDPAVLRKRRHAELAGYGLTPEEVRRFENAPILTPTRQAVLIEAVKTFNGVAGREELLRHASTVSSEEEIGVFLSSTRLLLKFHARTKVARILAGPRLPTAQLADGGVEVFGAFDAMQWTEEVAGYERTLRQTLPADAPLRELWLLGSVSPRARAALTELGWTVRDHADEALAPAVAPQPPTQAPPSAPPQPIPAPTPPPPSAAPTPQPWLPPPEPARPG
jgi:hypothetical protein